MGKLVLMAGKNSKQGQMREGIDGIEKEIMEEEEACKMRENDREQKQRKRNAEGKRTLARGGQLKEKERGKS